VAPWSAMSSSRVRTPTVVVRPAAVVGVGLVAWAVLLAVVEFARWPALSWSVGATCLGTVYQAVNAVPTVLFDVAAGVSLAAVGVPLLVGALGHGRPRDAPRLGSAVLTWTVTVLGACSVAAWFAAEPVAAALVGASGCTGAVDVGAAIVRWFAPQPVLLGAGVVLAGNLRAHARPAAAAAGPALASLVLVGTFVAFQRLAADGDATGVPESHLAVLAGGTTAAALVLAVVPVVLLWRRETLPRPTFRVPRALGAETRGVVTACALSLLGQLFAAVAAVVVTFRSGVGVLPVHAYVVGALLLSYALLLLPVVAGSLRRLAGLAAAPAPVAVAAEPVLTRSARHRRAPRVSTLALQARGAVTVGAVAAAAVAAAAVPIGGFFAGLDAARETTQGAAALDAVAPGLWAASASLVLVGLAAVLCAALYVRGRAVVAGGAVAAAYLIAGGLALVAVMPGASPTWTLTALGLAGVAGLTLATLDLLAATSRAWGPGALAGLGRTVVVAVLAAALGAAAGVLVARWWIVDDPWANLGSAALLALLGGLVTTGVITLFDRDLGRWLWALARPVDAVREQ
jgi:putative peptidoglycan lipid II flippase